MGVSSTELEFTDGVLVAAIGAIVDEVVVVVRAEGGGWVQH